MFRSLTSLKCQCGQCMIEFIAMCLLYNRFFIKLQILRAGSPVIDQMVTGFLLQTLIFLVDLQCHFLESNSP